MVGEDSSEVAALVYMMQESVLSVQSPADIEAFAQRFTVDQLCSLLRMRGSNSVQALQGLFREPIASASGSVRPPHQAFLAQRFLVQEHPTAAMHRGITSRYTDESGEKQVDLFNPPLADQHRIHGLFGFGRANALCTVEFKVCVFPYILQFKVLQAFASTKNMALFETVECEAILKAAWAKIRYRYIADCVLEIGVVAVLCVMTEKVRTGDREVVWLILFVLELAKELAEEVWSAYVHSFDLSEYFSVHNAMHWGRLLLSGFFCVLHLRDAAPAVQRPVLAGVVIVQWFKLLARGRAFELLGPKLLPIMYTLKAMGPFLVVLFFYVGAFLHAFWALSSRPVGEVFTIGYRLGIMGDFQLHEGRASILEGEEEEEGEHDMDVWLLIWFFICSALLTLFMMNVVIGVLGESYDIEHDQAHVSFLRSRAAICAEYSSRIWKVQRPVAMYSVLRHGLHLAQKSTPRCLLWLAATMPVSVCYGLLRCVVAEWNCYDYHGRYTGLDTTAPFLWVCLSTEQQSRSRDAEASRMQIMCSRIDNSIYKMQQAIHGGLADAEDKRKADSANIDSMNARMGRMERILTELAGRAHHSDQQHTDAPLRQPSSAPSSIHTCPFSGVSLPAEATATQAHPRPHANGQGTRSEEEASGAEQPEVEGRAGAQPRRADGRKVPADVFFYGPHLASIEEMVMETYGVDAWHSVKEKAGLAEFSDGDFVQSQQYDQNCVVLPIVRAITEELGLGEEQTYHALGTHFVAKYLDRNGYLDMLRMRGKTLREFMDSMDALHVNIEKAYPKGLAFPSFKTSDADVGFLLHYWSFRPGLWPMAAGQVEAIGQVLFGQETMLQVLRQSEEEGVHYVLFQVLHGADVQQQRPRNGEHGMVEEGGRPARAEPDGAGQREAARECPRRPDRQVPPAEERIYGLVNDCVEKLVINRSGRHTWHAIKARAGLVDVQDGDFLKSQQYDQDLLYRLVAASSEELQITMEETLEAAGDFFISEYTPRHGYLKLLQAQGRNLREFMDSMDRMHAHLKRNGHPGLAPPSFKTEDAKGMPGFLLHYWSFRPGLSPMVKGMVRASGRLLFSQETRLEVLKSSEEGGVHYVLFHVAPPLKRHHTRIQLPLTPLPTA